MAPPVTGLRAPAAAAMNARTGTSHAGRGPTDGVVLIAGSSRDHWSRGPPNGNDRARGTGGSPHYVRTNLAHMYGQVTAGSSVGSVRGRSAGRAAAPSEGSEPSTGRRKKTRRRLRRLR